MLLAVRYDVLSLFVVDAVVYEVDTRLLEVGISAMALHAAGITRTLCTDDGVKR